jgi:hypothetical protein
MRLWVAANSDGDLDAALPICFVLYTDGNKRCRHPRKLDLRTAFEALRRYPLLPATILERFGSLPMRLRD